MELTNNPVCYSVDYSYPTITVITKDMYEQQFEIYIQAHIDIGLTGHTMRSDLIGHHLVLQQFPGVYVR